MNFNEIAVDIRTPGQYIEFDNSRASQGLAAMPHKILVLGQRLVAGTVAAGVPTLITSAAQAEAAFGRGSMLAAMFAALKAANPRTESWAVALDDAGAGVAAAGILTPGGPATKAGSLVLYVAGKRVPVGIASADTRDQIADKITAAINADTSLPVTAASTGVVGSKVTTVTARHKGVAGNYIDLRVNYYQGETLPSGVTLAITAMTGGTTNPDIATALTAIGDTQYHTVVMPYSDTANLTALETELARRWGPMVMKEGHAIASVTGALAAMQGIGAARNSPHLTILGAGKSPNAPWVWAAVAAGVEADATQADPARPRQTLALPGLLPPAEQDRLTRDERDLLLHDGISTHTADAGGVVRVERLITAYQTNAQGIEDTSYLDITTLRTLAYLRYTVRARIGLKYPRHKLASDGTQAAPGQAVVTPKDIRNELLALFRDWELAGLVEGFEQFKTDLVVSRSGTDPNRVDAVIPPDVINGFGVFAAQVQFRL